MKLFSRLVRACFFAGLCGFVNLMALGCTKTKPTMPRTPGSNEPLGYAKDIEEIVSKFCFECHGDENQEAELDLRTANSMLSGGESGPAIVPGHPELSLLLDMIHDGHMPPEGETLTARDIERVRQWIASGARP